MAKVLLIFRGTCVFNDADHFKNCITKVKYEKPEHEGNGILAVNKHIGDHHHDIQKKLDNNGKQEGIDKADEPFLK
jgi:hypothetical protein